MSIRKITEREFSDVIRRLMDLAGLTQESQVADLLNYSPQALSQSKKRGSLPLNRLLRVCSEKGWDFDWVTTGRNSATAIDSDKPVTVSINGGKAHIDVHHYAKEETEPYEDPVNKAFLSDWLKLSDVAKMRIWTLIKEEIEKM